MSILYVLGAADPEMQVIEDLLKDYGVDYTYAVVGDSRVHPGNMYKATGVDPPEKFEDYETVVLVECDLATPISGVGTVIRVDHHRPGDRGCGLPPGEFLGASSVGQVYALLMSRGHSTCASYVPPGTTVQWDCDCSPDLVSYAEVMHPRHMEDCHTYPADGWVLTVHGRGVHSPAGDDENVPHEIVMAAAADHCLGHAYQGRCPGVDPDRLMAWRVATRAAHQGRSAGEVMEDISRARTILLRAGKIIPTREDEDDHSAIVDLRGQFIPELPEAAAREGIAYYATVPPTAREPRTKIVLGAADPEQVRVWMEWAERVEGLNDIYGDPARGFAGGYL